MSDVQHDIDCEHFAEAASLAAVVQTQWEEIDRLTAERDRLRGGIEAHRDYDFPEGSFTPAERFSQAIAASERLWSLLDDHADCSHLGGQHP